MVNKEKTVIVIGLPDMGPISAMIASTKEKAEELCREAIECYTSGSIEPLEFDGDMWNSIFMCNRQVELEVFVNQEDTHGDLWIFHIEGVPLHE